MTFLAMNKRFTVIASIALMALGAFFWVTWHFYSGLLVNIIQLGMLHWTMKFGVRQSTTLPPPPEKPELPS